MDTNDNLKGKTKNSVLSSSIFLKPTKMALGRPLRDIYPFSVVFKELKPMENFFKLLRSIHI